MDYPRRKPNRLRTFDYSSDGAYFITICTQGRRNMLCDIVGDGFPVPKTAGTIAEMYVREIPVKYPCVSIDNYVIMPNHIHLLLSMDRKSGTGNPSPTLGNVIGWYKYNVTKEIRMKYGEQGERFFQRSYHDHVIRNDRDYQKIWYYIEGNPSKWAEDCFYVKE